MKNCDQMFPTPPVRPKIVAALDEVLMQIEFPKKDIKLRLSPAIFDELKSYLDSLEEFNETLGIKRVPLGTERLPKVISLYNIYDQKITLLKWDKGNGNI